jgi:hypothetical protein
VLELRLHTPHALFDPAAHTGEGQEEGQKSGFRSLEGSVGGCESRLPSITDS